MLLYNHPPNGKWMSTQEITLLIHCYRILLLFALCIMCVCLGSAITCHCGCFKLSYSSAASSLTHEIVPNDTAHKWKERRKNRKVEAWPLFYYSTPLGRLPFVPKRPPLNSDVLTTDKNDSIIMTIHIHPLYFVISHRTFCFAKI